MYRYQGLLAGGSRKRAKLFRCNSSSGCYYFVLKPGHAAIKGKYKALIKRFSGK